MFTPGEMNERVTFKSLTTTADGYGGRVTAWIDVDTVWAHVRPLSGKEFESYDGVQAEGLNLFVTRYRDDIVESNKITWEGVDYNIVEIKKTTGRNLYTEFVAARGVPQ